MGLRRQCNGCAEKAGERLIRDASATVRKLSCWEIGGNFNVDHKRVKSQLVFVDAAN